MANEKTTVKTKRTLRNYTVMDAEYLKAMNRAAQERHQLSSLINEVVVAYGNGADLIKFLNDNKKYSSQAKNNQ